MQEPTDANNNQKTTTAENAAFRLLEAMQNYSYYIPMGFPMGQSRLKSAYPVKCVKTHERCPTCCQTAQVFRPGKTQRAVTLVFDENVNVNVTMSI